MKKFAALFVLFPLVAHAHADHSAEALTTEHMLHSPFHAGVIAIALIGIALVVRMLLREARAERRHRDHDK